jgi:hypothetical protein
MQVWAGGHPRPPVLGVISLRFMWLKRDKLVIRSELANETRSRQGIRIHTGQERQLSAT